MDERGDGLIVVRLAGRIGRRRETVRAHVVHVFGGLVLRVRARALAPFRLRDCDVVIVSFVCHSQTSCTYAARVTGNTYKWEVVGVLWLAVVLNYADRQPLSGT